jgi:hypothetical protein
MGLLDSIKEALSPPDPPAREPVLLEAKHVDRSAPTEVVDQPAADGPTGGRHARRE